MAKMEIDMASEDPVCLLVEILSGKNLVIRDRHAKSSDPYIKVKLNNRDIHSTKKISKSLNPVYGESQNNAFILDCSAKQLFDNQGLLFKVKDHNMMSKDEDMGSVQVPAMEIYNATGEPMELALVAPTDLPKGTNAGTIVVRCWPATETHLKKFGKNQKGLLGFIKKAEERAKTMQSNAKEQMSQAKEKMSTAVHDVASKAQDVAMDVSNKAQDVSTKMKEAVPFATTKEEEEEPNLQEEDGPIAPAKELPIDSIPRVDTEDTDEGGVDKKNLMDESSAGAHVMGVLKIVIEIVGGRNLLIGDATSSDPYVKVMLGNKEVHKTKHLTKTLNPVFTPELESTFILECTDATLSDKNGLVFIVKDWDLFGGNDELGTVQVAYTTLVKGDGAPREFVIIPPKGEDKPAGNLLIRCRPASSKDEEAMKDKKNRKNLFPTTSAEVVATAWGSAGNDKKEDAAPAQAAPKQPLADRSEKSAASEEPVAGGTSKAVEVVAEPKEGEELHLKVEIVSCRGLIAADKNGLSDPYVKLSLAGKDLHKTKHILKTLNPVFQDMDNIFTLHCPASELYQAGGLVFTVKDWDRIGKNDDLGQLTVPASKIYNNMMGEEIEVKINPPKGHEGEDAGYLKIRCTSTTAEDHTGEKKKFLGMKVPEIKAPQINMPKIKPVTEIFNKTAAEIDENEEVEPMFIQIVSCRDLLVADKTGSSDPYVKVKLGKKSVHETKHILKTLNPTYSTQHNCFFVLDARPSEVKAAGGVTFKVKDWDRVGADDDLGTAVLDAETFFKCQGGNMEMKLSPPKGIGEEAGFITIRCRPATESDRASKKSFFGGLSSTCPLDDYGKIDLHLLIEIVSAWQIPIADMTSSDPYVKVKIGPRNIHETKPIKNTRDPIYTLMHDSVFVLDTATKELTENGGMTFKVKDYDLIGSNDDLCEVTVPAEKILEATGERLELELKAGDNDAGWLAIRVRPVTEYDREFLKDLKSRQKKGGRVFNKFRSSYDQAMKPAVGSGNLLKKAFTKMVKEVDGVKKFRVRPFPDPERPKETEFMSEQEIDAEAFKPSRKWLEIGSGTLGKVYVEILGCDGLPNKDVDFGTGNKTDPFVSIVYEDCMAKTDTIDDSLSPRWLPWMQRAFIFRMMHTSSNLHIGVFDFDPGFASDHDICGRVSVDLANLQPDTEYLLRYNIYENSCMPDREPKGVVMLRLRMELKEEKDLILSNLQMPPEYYVNVKEAKDFDLVRQTIGGRQDLQAYSQSTIGLYVEELTGFSVLKYYIIDSIISILFWRGQVRVYGIWIPIHSMAVFFAATTLAERPSLYPSFSFFTLGWLLLSIQTWRNNTSNPWHKTKTFMSLTQEFLTSMSIDGPPTTIAAHEKEEESKAEDQANKDRIEKANKAAEEYQKQQMELLAEHEAMMAQVGDQNADTDISTQGGGVSIDPLKFILYPIQQYLALVCHWLRVIKNVMIWDEPYIAYIITLASFAIGVVFLIVPWAFIIRWTSRILAWVLLGPHMKLVDLFWYSKLEDLTEQEQREQIKEQFQAQLITARQYASQARMLREDAVKLKAIKKELFGKFITRVPVIRAERFVDIPLFSSTATPYKAPANMPPVEIERVDGQHLVGHMIPRIPEDEDEAPSPKDEEAKKND